MDGSAWLLLTAVGTVGVLHTIVPDHWVPIVVLARRRGWTAGETARAALQAGIGHVTSTLGIAAFAWIGGVAAARRFGSGVDTAASLALVGFGTWIAVSAWREVRTLEHVHSHSHGHERDAKSRTALLLILGSSPMVEGIPAFFAASRYGAGLVLAMSLVFGATTIAMYVVLCAGSTVGVRRFGLGPFERYGEVLSGAFIALVGLGFLVWPAI
jgi:hypothetical protein